MAPFIAPPDPWALLPPLLACLPMAFCSTRPPPDLLPMLSPILRQRLRFLPSTGTTAEGSWLTLLCGDPTEAEELVTKVESTTFEAHPVSGEIELGDIGPARFRRRDEETLQSLLKLPEQGLSVVYVWCEDDEAGGGPGWRVSEMGVFERTDDHNEIPWEETVGQANAHFENNRSSTKSRTLDAAQPATDKEEDDYWALYDATPSRTPGPKPPQSSGQMADHSTISMESSSDAEYYARYNDVQPAADNFDPDQAHEPVGETTLHGNELITGNKDVPGSFPLLGQSSHLNGDEKSNPENLVHVRTASSSSGPVVSHLEDAARHQSHSEMAVQQHIGSSVKSLYRLAHGAGIETSEFKRLIRTELDLLDLLEED